MDITVKPCRPEGIFTPPGSKSFIHRALVCLALADGEGKIGNICPGDDIKASAACADALKSDASAPVFPCGESGSTLRFFLPAALTKARNSVFTGSERLFEREGGLYAEIFKDKGISIKRSGKGLEVSGKLTPGEYILPGDVSSQYISGLLMALPLLGGESRITLTTPLESKKYVDMTLEVMKYFGIDNIKKDEKGFVVPGFCKYSPGVVNAPGDWSAAACFYAFNFVGGNITVNGLDKKGNQSDSICLSLFENADKEDFSADISDCPDLGPLLFALAAAKNGGSFTGTKRLRLKESDRCAVMALELRKFGIETVSEENRFTVLPGRLNTPDEIICGHNDHRIIMALTLLLTLCGGRLSGAEAVSKSMPGFFDELKKLGAKITTEEKQ